MYDQLAADAQNRYLVTYTPTNTVTRRRAGAAVSLTTASDAVRRAHASRISGAEAAADPADARVHGYGSRPVSTSRSAPTTSLSPRTASIRRSIRFTKPTTPLSIVLALDASGSMRKSADALMSAARTFVDALRPEDKLSLLFFSDGVLVAHDLGTNRQTSIDAINGYKPVGGTALYDAMADAFTTLKTVEGRRAVVVMTDGRDENNPGTAPGSSPHAASGPGARERGRRDSSADRAGHQPRSERPGAPGRHFGRGRLLSDGRVRAPRAVCEDD